MEKTNSSGGEEHSDFSSMIEKRELHSPLEGEASVVSFAVKKKRSLRELVLSYEILSVPISERM